MLVPRGESVVSTRVQLLVFVLCVLVASVALAAYWVASSDPRAAFAVRTAFIAMGPGSGWLIAYFDDALPRALPFLATVTALSAAPLAAWFMSRNPGWLGFATLSWIGSGYLLGVALWI